MVKVVPSKILFKSQILLFLLCMSSSGIAQVFWTEDFGTDGGSCASQLETVSSYSGGNGAWSMTDNGPGIACAAPTTPNEWYVSTPEAGMGTGNCGDGCLANSALTNKTLHIANISTSPSAAFFCSTGDCGAAYDSGGLCDGFALSPSVETDKRAESPTIDCSGKDSIFLCFSYIEGGETTLDNATVMYFDGATWSQIADPGKTSTCGVGQGLWTEFTIVLPSTADNNANVQIGFRWVNDDNGSGADPSFAVDDITLFTLPTVDTVAGNSSICINDTGEPYTIQSTTGFSYAWTLSGGGTIASGQGTDSIEIDWGSTPGTYIVSVIESRCGIDIIHDSLTVTVSSCGGPPVANFGTADTLICEGTCIAFNDSSTNAPTSWAWSFPGATPDTSNDQNPASICYNTPGIYSVTLTATNGSGSDDTTFTNYITVDTAATVGAGANDTICTGATYTLSGIIGGGASSSMWTTGGDGTFDDSSLVAATYTPGSADIAAGSADLILTTDDPTGPCIALTDSMLLTIDPVATAFAGPDDTICSVGTFTISGASIGGSASSSTWITLGSGTFDDSSLIGATYTPSTGDTGAGCIQLVLTTDDPAGPCGSVTDTMNLCFIVCPPPVADFTVSNTALCEGDCISFTDQSTNSPSTWAWSFTGAAPDTSNDQNPVNICYNTPGTYTVSLTVSNTNGSDDTIMTALITVDSAATAFAGADDTICSGSSYTLSGVIGGTASSSTWATAGDGSFDDSTLLAATYSPGASDISSGTVTLILTTDDPAGNCTADLDSMTLSIDPTATVNTGVNDTICEGSSYTLAGAIGGSASTSLWSTLGDGTFNDTTQLNAIYAPGSSDISSGSVVLILSTDDPTGPCTGAVDSITLVINPTPAVDSVTVVDASNCSVSDGSALVHASSGTAPYQFSIDGGSTFSSDSNFAGLSTGTYNVLITDNAGCSDSSSFFTISAPGVPSAPVTSSDSTYCQGDSIAPITATGSNIEWWSDAALTILLDSGSSYNPDTTVGTTTYYATQTVSGCQSLPGSTTIVVVDTCNTAQASFTYNSSGCVPTHCVAFSDKSSNATSWLWLFPGGNPSSGSTQTPSLVCYSTAGVYDVTLIVSNSTSSDTLFMPGIVTAYANPVLVVSNDTTIILGDTITLVASGADFINWSTGPSISSIVASPNQTTTYGVIGIDSSGCYDSAEVTVTVISNNTIYVPNVFSSGSSNPDNKKLYVFGTGIETIELVIYDRWGEKVYETNVATKSLRNDGQCCIYGEGWDGTFRTTGKPVNSAVFAYILKAKFLDGEKHTEQGNITLIK